MSEYTICSRCNEKPAAICLSCLTDCTLKQQPSAGKFTKKLKLRLPNMLPDSYEGMKSLCATLTDTVNEACDIIDTSEARLKDLLEACKGLMDKADDGSADFDDPEPGSIYLKAKAAITKAKNKG